VKLSKHFNDWELISPYFLEVIRLADVPASWYVAQNQLDALEDIRDNFGKPVLVNINESFASHYGFSEPMYRRGICTDQECLDAGRKLTSQHCCRGAYDITVIGISPIEVGEHIDKIAEKYNIGGMGMNMVNNFTHIDFRHSNSIVRWEY